MSQLLVESFLDRSAVILMNVDSLATLCRPEGCKHIAMKEIARNMKRNQLVRSWRSVVREYPPVNGMDKEQAADYLLALEDQGKLTISFKCVDELIEVQIQRPS